MMLNQTREQNVYVYESSLLSKQVAKMSYVFNSQRRVGHVKFMLQTITNILYINIKLHHIDLNGMRLYLKRW